MAEETEETVTVTPENPDYVTVVGGMFSNGDKAYIAAVMHWDKQEDGYMPTQLRGKHRSSVMASNEAVALAKTTGLEMRGI